MNDLDKVLRTLGVEEVEDEEILEKLETRRGGRESNIRKFLMNAEIGKWYKVEFNIGAVYREAKRIGVKIKATKFEGNNYVKILERP